MRPHTILIIEDNEQNLYLLRFLLEKNGFLVSDATTGQRGLALARELNPDLILLDIQLPEMDGYEVAAELRKLDSEARTPIIAVTSHAMVGDREKALEAGATDYIEKPINPDTFVLQIRRHLPAVPRERGPGGSA
jgi:two-component system cell cycle response regulator DivK